MKKKRTASTVCLYLGILLLSISLISAVWIVWNGIERGRTAEKTVQAIQEVILSGTNMETAEIDGHGYIGYLSIPDIDRELPVMGDLTDDKLKVAPCRYYGGTAANDMVIGAHNYPQFFGRLKRLAVGDVLSFIDLTGHEWRYVVAEVEVLAEDQVEEMIGSGYPLSLFTCTDDNVDRLTVRCNLLER